MTVQSLTEMSACVTKAICLYQSMLCLKIKTHLANESSVVYYVVHQAHNSAQIHFLFPEIESKHSTSCVFPATSDWTRLTERGEMIKQPHSRSRHFKIAVPDEHS